MFIFEGCSEDKALVGSQEFCSISQFQHLPVSSNSSSNTLPGLKEISRPKPSNATSYASYRRPGRHGWDVWLAAFHCVSRELDEPCSNEPSPNEAHTNGPCTNESFPNEACTHVSSPDEACTNEPCTNKARTDGPSSNEPRTNEPSPNEPRTNEPYTHELCTENVYTSP